MTADIKKVLAESTPRPWLEGFLVCSMEDRIPDAGECIANWKLVRLAVNSYEADQERMRVLTEALEEANVALTTLDYLTGGKSGVSETLTKIRTALSQAKGGE